MMTPEQVEYELLKHFESETRETRLTVTDTGAEYKGLLGTYHIAFDGTVTMPNGEVVNL